MSSQQDCNLEDKPIQLSPGMVPDTYGFKCPSSMCNPTADTNNNVSEKPNSDKPSSAPDKTVDQCEEEKPQEPKVAAAKEPVPVEEVAKKEEVKCSEEDKKNKPCGSSLSGNLAKSDCDCGKPIAPIPKVNKACGCSGKNANCGPNTSCEVTPLYMQKKSRNS